MKYTEYRKQGFDEIRRTFAVGLSDSFNGHNSYSHLTSLVGSITSFDIGLNPHVVAPATQRLPIPPFLDSMYFIFDLLLSYTMTVAVSTPYKSKMCG